MVQQCCNLSTDQLESFSLTLSNDSAQKTVIGYDKTKNEYYIDRTVVGQDRF